METELLTDNEKQKIRELPEHRRLSELKDEIKIAGLLKNPLLSDENLQEILKRRDYDDPPWRIVQMLEAEIAFQEPYQSKFLSAEEKETYLAMKGNKRYETIIKKMITAIEKAKRIQAKALKKTV